MSTHLYAFGNFRVSPRRRVLECEGEILPLPTKAVETLLVLLEQHGQLVLKEDLLARAWPDVVVEENSLNQAISALRKALGDSPAAPRFIETVARRGYRFVAEVTRQAAPAPARERSVNARAYLLYLKGRHLSSRLTAASFREGLACFEEALRLEPDDPLSHEGLAYHLMMGLDLFISPKDACPRALAAAERAITLDPDSSAAHTALGSVQLFYTWDFAAAEERFMEALTLELESPHALRLYAWANIFWQRFDTASELLRRARAKDSFSLDAYNYAMGSLYFSRRYREGLAEADEAIRTYPDFWLLRVLRARCLEELGRLPEAIAGLAALGDRGEVPNEVLGDLGRIFGRMGEVEEARRVLRELDRRQGQGYLPPFHRAVTHLGLGDTAACLDGLEAAFEERSWYMLWLRVAPFFDALRGHPRFDALCGKVGV